MLKFLAALKLLALANSQKNKDATRSCLVSRVFMFLIEMYLLSTREVRRLIQRLLSPLLFMLVALLL
jgi:hypothetical protein